MSKQEGILIDAPYPLIWMANYPVTMGEITIPACEECGEPCRIDRKMCGCSAGHTLDPKKGARIIEFDEANPGVITEFDSEGGETVPFGLLPRENLVYFSLVDPCVNPVRFYTFDLRTGRFLVNQMPVGIAVTTPGQNSRDLQYISDASFVGKTIELFHHKHNEMVMSGRVIATKNEFDEIMAALELDPASTLISNIDAGYRYVFKKADESGPELIAEARLSVDCETHVPYLTSRIYPNEGT